MAASRNSPAASRKVSSEKPHRRGFSAVGRPKVVVFGAGGHGQVILDVIRTQGAAEVVGFLDDRDELKGQEIAGAPVIGPTAAARELIRDGVTHFVVAIGDNKIRAEKYQQLLDWGLKPWSAIHPSAIIAQSAQLSQGVQIIAGVVVNPGAVIGQNVILNTACSVDHHCKIGDHAFIGPGAHLGGAVTVGKFAFLGIGAIVLPGVSIGEGTLVGAGAVVTKDVPPYKVAVGIPARAIRSRDR